PGHEKGAIWLKQARSGADHARVDLRSLLSWAVEAGASDIHLKIGQPPIARCDGMLGVVEGWSSLEREQLERVLQIVTEHDQARLASFGKTNELDLAYTPRGLPRFRVNGFRQRGAISFAMRLIPDDIPSFPDLGLPDGVSLLAEEQRGLVLCTG